MVNKYLKRCLTSLVIREMPSDTTMGCFYTPARLDKMQKIIPSPKGHCWWECKLIEHFGKLFMRTHLNWTYVYCVPGLGNFNPMSTLYRKAYIKFIFHNCSQQQLLPQTGNYVHGHHGRMDELWFSHIMEYYTAMRMRKQQLQLCATIDSHK